MVTEYGMSLRKKFKRFGQKKNKVPEYLAWKAMKRRIFDRNQKCYKHYAGRGISICDGLMDYENFIEIIGNKPSKKHSVDRINNDKSYSCGECEECLEKRWKMNIRWATTNQQARNKRNTNLVVYKGEEKPLADWAEIIGINYNCLRARLYQWGWSVKRSFTTPLILEINGIKVRTGFRDLREISPIGCWTVLELYGRVNGRTLWLCRCDCGNEAIVDAGILMNGKNLGCKKCIGEKRNGKKNNSKNRS